MRMRWKIGRIIANILAQLLFGFQVINRPKPVTNQGKILVANHLSNLDPFFVALACGQEVYFMAKEELFNVSRFFRWLITFWNAIPLPRSQVQTTLLKKCLALLKENKTLVMFPEGTRNKSDDILLPFKPGIGYLAINGQVPVIPVAIFGVREVWRGRLAKLIDKDISRYFKTNGKLPKIKNRVIVEFGHPIYPNQYEKSRAGYDQFTQTIRAKLQTMLIKYLAR